MAHPDPYGADAARERREAWYSSTDPAERDRAYAAVLRRQFGRDAPPAPAVEDTAPL